MTDFGPGSYGRNDPARALPGDNSLASGGDHRLPQTAGSDPRKLAKLAEKASVQLQRAANKLMSRLRHLNMFGEGTAEKARHDDQVGIQLLYELRRTLDELESIKDLEPVQRVNALRIRLNGLQSMGQLHQSMLAEVTRITGQTQGTLISLAKLALEKQGNGDDDITDAELANE